MKRRYGLFLLISYLVYMFLLAFVKTFVGKVEDQDPRVEGQPPGHRPLEPRKYNGLYPEGMGAYGDLDWKVWLGMVMYAIAICCIIVGQTFILFESDQDIML